MFLGPGFVNDVFGYGPGALEDRCVFVGIVGGSGDEMGYVDDGWGDADTEGYVGCG